MELFDGSKPERQVTFICKIGADSWEEMLRALDQIHFELSRKPVKGESTTVTSGAPDWGGSWAVRVDPNMNHNLYFQQIDAWLEAQDKQPVDIASREGQAR